MRAIRGIAYIVLALVMNSCLRVDTNSQPLFDQVQCAILDRADQMVYWDSSIHECVDVIELDGALTQERVVQIALLNNRNLQASYEDLGIAKANLAQASLLRNPIFALAYRFPTQAMASDLVDMDLVQNFLEMLLIPVKKRAACAEIEATKSMLIGKILDVIAEAKIAFYALQAAQHTLELKNQIFFAAELSYEAAQKLFAAGNLRDLEVSQERLLYEQSKLELAICETVVLEQRERLNRVMGLWGCQIDWALTSISLQVPDVEEGYDTIENDAIARSVDLKMVCADLMATAAIFGMDTTRIVFPQFDMGVSSELEDRIWYVGPAFNIPIPLFDFGQANSAKAKAAIMQQWNTYSALAVEVRSRARSARFHCLNAFAQARYLEQVITPLSEQMTHQVLLQNNAMQKGVFHLLEAKRRELETKIQTVEQQKEYWTCKVVLQTLLSGHMFGGYE